MPQVVILSSSIRTGRKSHRVALYLRNYLLETGLAIPDLIDLKQCAFPLFDERLNFQENPLPLAVAFAAKIKSAEGILIVTPEYNGGYPASLKNAVDLLGEEWRRKPVAVAAVSEGPFGGSQVVTSLQFTLWKMGALVVPAKFHVAKVDEAYGENGEPADKVASDRRAASFVQELLWCMGKN